MNLVIALGARRAAGRLGAGAETGACRQSLHADHSSGHVALKLLAVGSAKKGPPQFVVVTRRGEAGVVPAAALALLRRRTAGPQAEKQAAQDHLAHQLGHFRELGVR